MIRYEPVFSIQFVLMKHCLVKPGTFNMSVVEGNNDSAGVNLSSRSLFS